MEGKDQKNLTEFSGQCLWPYILPESYVHVCSRSTDTYCISPYLVPMKVRVSHKCQEWKHNRD